MAFLRLNLYKNLYELNWPKLLLILIYFCPLFSFSQNTCRDFYNIKKSKKEIYLQQIFDPNSVNLKYREDLKRNDEINPDFENQYLPVSNFLNMGQKLIDGRLKITDFADPKKSGAFIGTLDFKPVFLKRVHLPEIHFTYLLGQIGLGPQLLGVLEIGSTRYMITEWVNGRVFNRKKFPYKNWSLARRQKLDLELLKKVDQLNELGIAAGDLQFQIGVKGENWIIDAEIFQFVPPNHARDLNAKFYSVLRELLLNPVSDEK
jgi:hypothetical protein